MSCATNSRQVCKAGVADGVSRLSGKLSYTAGIMAATRSLDRIGQATAPLNAIALEIIGPTNPGTIKRQVVLRRSAIGLARGANMLAALTGKSCRLTRISPLVLKVRLVAKAAEIATGAVGSDLAELSKTGEAGQVIQQKRAFLFFKSQTRVPFWRSRLTPLLNKRDVIGYRKMVENTGVMFQMGGKSWHRGAIRFKTSRGERTIAHLQSLSIPGRHYYFERPLSNEQAAGIAAGQVKAETVSGFVGQIGSTESLCPAWAEIKRGMILARLHWLPEKR